MKIQKLFAALISGAIMITAFSLGVSAKIVSVPDFVIKGSSAEAAPGGKASFEITAENNPGFLALQLGYEFNEEYFSISKEEVINHVEGFNITQAKNTVWDGLNVYSGDKLCTMVFNVSKNTPPGEYSIGLIFKSASDENYNSYRDAKTYPATIIVKESISGVQLDHHTLDLKVGEEKVLTAKFSPENVSNKNVSWKSDNESVASVDNTGKVTALKEGSAMITVTTEVGNFSDTCAVTVTSATVTCSHPEDKIKDVAAEPSTCIKQGHDAYKVCELCQAIIEGSDELLPFAEHKYGEWIIIKEATSTEKGTRERTCQVCGNKETEDIPIINCTHEQTEEVAAVASTCVKHGHDAYTICKICGTIINGSNAELPLAEHKYGEWTVIKEATSTETGRRERTCQVCGNKETEDIPIINCTHEQTEEVAAVASTCVKHGHDAYTICKICGTIINGSNAELPLAEHTYGEWTIVKKPTGTEEGFRERICSVCNNKQSETVTKLSDITKTDSNTNISVFIPADAFENPDVNFVVNPLDNSSVQLSDKSLIVKAAFDISFERNGEKVQPNTNTTISIPIPANINTAYSKVLHITENNETENVNARIENGFFVFEVNHFSKFAIVEAIYDLSSSLPPYLIPGFTDITSTTNEDTIGPDLVEDTEDENNEELEDEKDNTDEENTSEDDSTDSEDDSTDSEDTDEKDDIFDNAFEENPSEENDSYQEDSNEENTYEDNSGEEDNSYEDDAGEENTHEEDSSEEDNSYGEDAGEENKYEDNSNKEYKSYDGGVYVDNTDDALSNATMLPFTTESPEPVTDNIPSEDNSSGQNSENSLNDNTNESPITSASEPEDKDEPPATGIDTCLGILAAAVALGLVFLKKQKH